MRTQLAHTNRAGPFSMMKNLRTKTVRYYAQAHERTEIHIYTDIFAMNERNGNMEGSRTLPEQWKRCHTHSIRCVVMGNWHVKRFRCACLCANRYLLNSFVRWKHALHNTKRMSECMLVVLFTMLLLCVYVPASQPVADICCSYLQSNNTQTEDATVYTLNVSHTVKLKRKICQRKSQEKNTHLKRTDSKIPCKLPHHPSLSLAPLLGNVLNAGCHSFGIYLWIECLSNSRNL